MEKNKNISYVGAYILMSGTIISQIIMLIVSPIITRIYSPDQFGLFSVYLSLVSLASIIATLRYEGAIPLPEDDDKAQQIMRLSFFLIIIFTILCYILFMPFLFLIDNNNRILGLDINFFIIFPLGVFFLSFYNVSIHWNLRSGKYKSLAISRFMQTISNVLFVISLSAFQYGLIYSNIFSVFIGILVLSVSGNKTNLTKYKRGKYLAVLNEYIQFPKYGVWSSLFGSASILLVPILISFYFGLMWAGVYALSQRVLATPLSVIGDALGKIYIKESPNAYRNGHLSSTTFAMLCKLIDISVPLAFFVWIISENFFVIIFGEKWRGIGQIIQIILPFTVLSFIASPFGSIFRVLNQLNKGMIFDSILMLVRLSALTIGYILFDSAIPSLILFSILSFILWLWFILWLCVLLKISLLILFRRFAINLLFGIIITLPFLIGGVVGYFWIKFCFSLLIAGIYYLYLFKVNWINNS